MSTHFIQEDNYYSYNLYPFACQLELHVTLPYQLYGLSRSAFCCHTAALRDDQSNSSVIESVFVWFENSIGLEECGKMKLLSGTDLQFCLNCRKFVVVFY